MRDDDNLTTERPTFVTHLECAYTGERFEADRIHGLSSAGKPLLVRYDLAGVKKALTKDALAQRPPDLWRYRELLPVRRVADIVSLGEAVTPLLRLSNLARALGGGELIVKDEGRLPTGSFKARGLVMAVSMAKALGIKHMAMPTNGNAGAALAALRCKLRHWHQRSHHLSETHNVARMAHGQKLTIAPQVSRTARERVLTQRLAHAFEIVAHQQRLAGAREVVHRIGRIVLARVGAFEMRDEGRPFGR